MPRANRTKGDLGLSSPVPADPCVPIVCRSLKELSSARRGRLRKLPLIEPFFTPWFGDGMSQGKRDARRGWQDVKILFAVPVIVLSIKYVRSFLTELKMFTGLHTSPVWEAPGAL